MSPEQAVEYFEDATADAPGAMLEVFTEQAVKFRNDWRDNARENYDSHARGYAGDITAETHPGAGTVVAEIGPEDGGGPGHQGFLGRILEFGGEHSPAYLNAERALPVAEERLEQAAGDKLEELL